MFRAMRVACCMSLSAPAPMVPRKSSSAARPPMKEHISSRKPCLFTLTRSSGMVRFTPRAWPRGTIEILTSGWAYCKCHITVVCPASCTAVSYLSRLVSSIDLFSKPMVTLSMASPKSCMAMAGALRRAAMMAASLHTLAISATLMPVVWRASRLTSTLSSTTFFFKCTLNMASRSSSSGKFTCTLRSKRPGRSRAGSRMSSRLVAASTITPASPSMPSISVSSWLSVWSCSLLKPSLLRLAPTASISSMKTTQGAFSLASLKSSRTRLAPTPTNFSTNSEPEREKKGTWASPATARASMVLPVPGGPTSRAPLGTLPPRRPYLAGFFKKSTISVTSCLASSMPATSAKVMVPISECLSSRPLRRLVMASSKYLSDTASSSA